MSEDVKVVPELTDDFILMNSQLVRKKLVDELVKDGKVPTDNDSQYVLLSALKDMDKQVIDKRRAAIEDKNTNVAKVVADAVTKIAGMFAGNDPFKRRGVGEIPVVERDRIPEYIPAPGETEIGLTSDNYDGFMSKNGKASRQAGIESE